MIKLKPEHVGGRVLLSDGEVGFVASHDAQANEYKIDGDGFYFGAEQDDERITLLLDAPNPLDVPVPEWCEQVLLWFDGVGDFVCWGDIVTMESRAAKMSEAANSACEGWSPAPGQMPPKNNKEFN